MAIWTRLFLVATKQDYSIVSRIHIVYSWWTLITDLISDPFFIGVQGSGVFRCVLYSVFQMLDLKFVNHLIFDIHFGLNKKALFNSLKKGFWFEKAMLITSVYYSQTLFLKISGDGRPDEE